MKIQHSMISEHEPIGGTVARFSALIQRGLALACLAVLMTAVSCAPAPVPSGTSSSSTDGATGDSTVTESSTETESANETDESEEAVASEPAETEEAPGPNQVLRHAVFFSFKGSSTEEDIQGVVDAFRALPAKIDSIIDFEWGTNNSPEGLDDGFTHCFLLTFKDGAGRTEYLPHPAHKAFGDVLRPHNDKVFVIDYWGRSDQPDVENALRHAVFFKFKDDAPAEDVKAVEEAFAALPGKVDTIKAFEWGRNNSPERHSHGFTHCFMVTFDSDEGRSTYLPHPDHKAFVEVLKPVLDKVRVLDFNAQK